MSITQINPRPQKEGKYKSMFLRQTEAPAGRRRFKLPALRLSSAAYLLLLFLLLPWQQSCRVQKSRSDISPIAKFYHNTTAHYNGYFNAEELLNASLQHLNEQHQDDYTEILPIFPYRDVDNPAAEAEALDKAIEKVSVVVALHRPSDWTDDCYLLIAKAQYLKQDFEAAEETLDFFVREFNTFALAESKRKAALEKEKKKKQKQVKKKKKKKRKKKRRKKKKKKKTSSSKNSPKTGQKGKGENPAGRERQKEGTISLSDYRPVVEEGEEGQKPFLKRRPAFQEGLLWQARVYVERQKYRQAERIFQQLEWSPVAYDDLLRQLAAVKADYYIRRKQYDKAISALDKALELEKDKPLKARYAYIRGQLYERQGQDGKAAESFEQAIAFHPPYEMEFNAKLHLTESSWARGGISDEEAITRLKRMLKDEKNLEYQDRIYFTMGQIQLRAGKEEEAIASYEASLKASKGNDKLKAKTLLTLAELVYAREDYVRAKEYYDKALAVLDPKDERYADVQALAKNLSKIAENLQTIVLQDSLLRLSMLSEEEKRQFAYEKKKRELEARRQALLEKEKQKADAALLGGSGSVPTAGAKPSSFFAYDDREVKKGLRDFQNQWGGRSLQDNWRRSAAQNVQDLFENAKASEEDLLAAITDEEVADILKDVPTNDKEREIANDKIQKAMLALGELYRLRINRPDKSVDILEELMRRYPDTRFELEALYYLYLAYMDLGENAKAQEIADRITRLYPNSIYAHILQDPNYFDKQLSDEQRLTRYYENMYELFKQGQYEEVHRLAVEADKEFGRKHSYRARMALLDAMTKGKLESKEAYVQALKEFVVRFPNTPEEKQAKEMLRLLGEKVAGPVPGREQGKTSDTPFTFDPKAIHYIIIAFDGVVKLQDAKTKLADYHIKFHKHDKLKVASIYLGGADNRVPALVVRRFSNADKAMAYYRSASQNLSAYFDPETFKYHIYPISQRNYRSVLKQKSLNAYPEFFEEYYH